jgi:hypothetical protein
LGSQSSKSSRNDQADSCGQSLDSFIQVVFSFSHDRIEGYLLMLYYCAVKERIYLFGTVSLFVAYDEYKDAVRRQVVSFFQSNKPVQDFSSNLSLM